MQHKNDEKIVFVVAVMKDVIKLCRYLKKDDKNKYQTARKLFIRDQLS